MYDEFLKSLSRWCTDHYRKVLLVAVILTLVMGALAATLSINLSFLAILPDNDPEVDFFRSATDKFGGSSDLLLAIRGENQKQAIAFAESLAPKLREFDEVRSVDYKVDLEFAERYGLLFVAEKDLGRLAGALRQNRVLLKDLYRDLHFLPYVQKLGRLLERLAGTGPTDEEMTQFLQASRIGVRVLTEFAGKGRDVGEDDLEHIVVESMGADLDKSMAMYLQGGYAFSPDGSVMIASIRMKADLIRLPLGIVLYSQIDELTKQEAAKFPGLKAGYTGMMAMAYDDQHSVMLRFSWLSTISLALVVLLFFYISRLREGPLLIALPMLMAMAWTFGMVKLGLGFVSLTSMVFAVLLFGLGIDFAIHLMVRFNEEYRACEDARLAVQRAIQGSGRGIVTGGLTTAFAFFAMCIASYKPAMHLGYTTGWGVLCCLAAMMSVFPALLYWGFKKKSSRSSRAAVALSEENRPVTLWVTAVTRYPKLSLALCLALLLGFGNQIRHIEMEYDLEKMITRDMPSVAVKKMVNEKFGCTNEFVMVVADDLDEDREMAALLRNKTNAAGENIFARVDSISTYLPELSAQRARLAQMASIHAAVDELKVLDKAGPEALTPAEIAELADVVADMGLKLKAIKVFSTRAVGEELNALERDIHALREMLRVPSPKLRENLGYGQSFWAGRTEKMLAKFRDMSNPCIADGGKKILTPETLPAGLKDQFMSRTDGSFLILAFPKDASLAPANIREIKQALVEIAPHQGTGMMMIVDKFVTGGIKEFPLITGTVIVLIIGVLLLDFRSVKLLLISLLPLGFSAVISMGIICACDATVSVLMLTAFPLIFGIGIDDGVHVLHRYRESGDVIAAVSHTGRAILLTTVTTLVGFGALLFTNHNGLIGMGLLIGLGVTLCFVFSITVLPAVLILVDRRPAGEATCQR